MYRYLIIESKKEIKSDEQMIVSIFSEFINFEKIESHEKAIYLYYRQETDVSFLDIILNMMSDTLSDLRIFVSYQFDHMKDLEEHMEFIKRKLQVISFNKYVYLDDKVLLKSLIHAVDNEMKKFIFRKYLTDSIMQESIKTYLESNQNMSLASKKLYVHRNTLIQRLDKFYQTTGFDVRLFSDAYLIYHLIK
ncbi:MAG: helix-turn-helix domain-containing protein [Acholeplasmataceae bacterium]|nr:helix-turn-helix domain-containing protein [Acholeplasmataceae bacterium]